MSSPAETKFDRIADLIHELNVHRRREALLREAHPAMDHFGRQVCGSCIEDGECVPYPCEVVQILDSTPPPPAIET